MLRPHVSSRMSIDGTTSSQHDALPLRTRRRTGHTEPIQVSVGLVLTVLVSLIALTLLLVALRSTT
jgi:hypothetical protein